MNKAMITGNLIREPELRSTASGKSVCSFVAACSFRFDGKQYTDFIPVVAWDKLADSCSRYLGKGSKVLVVGKISVRDYEDRDGNRRRRTELIASEVEFLSKKKGGSTIKEPEASNEKQFSGDFEPLNDEQMPF